MRIYDEEVIKRSYYQDGGLYMNLVENHNLSLDEVDLIMEIVNGVHPPYTISSFDFNGSILVISTLIFSILRVPKYKILSNITGSVNNETFIEKRSDISRSPLKRIRIYNLRNRR